MDKKFKLPKRIKENTNKPIEIEAMLLEQEYMKLLEKGTLDEYEEFLLDYYHKRCNKLWTKIARKS
jgi:hypothetical protein